jgi:uncharacterized protein YjbJ (UPF0337 family)/uncharacterized membrane protein
MAERVAAIFDTREAAQRAADALADLGADREHISLLARGDEGTVASRTAPLGERDRDDFVEPAREVGDTGAPLTTADEDDTAAGAATGAAIGAVAGLAAGAMALMVPGFGLVLAAGPLAWALGGAAGATAAGAIAGGVYGGLRDIGIEEPYARSYEERIRGGDVLLTALVPSIAEERVLDILAEHGAEDVSFADDTSISQMPVTEATITSPDYRTTDTTDRDAAMPKPPIYATPGRDVNTIPEVGETTLGRTAIDTMPAGRETASYAESVVGATATTGAASDINVARGQVKQVEGERRDRAADFTASPIDDLAAKAKKAEGKVQETFGEAEETIEPRRP